MTAFVNILVKRIRSPFPIGKKKADAKELMIFRKGDVTSRLRFRRDTNTTATITSPYGSFEIALYTYFYRISEQMIVVEYDVLSDMREKTRLRFSWHIKGACS